MKNFILFITIISLSALYSDIPEGYYDSASGLSGSALKAALHNIIDDHYTYPYTSTSVDTWDILKDTDQDPENPDNVILLYTGWSVDAAQEYNSGSGWSREHVWPQSHGDFDTSQGIGTDCHHLRPADISVNSARGNKDYDNGGDEYYDDGGTIPTGCYSDPDSWEPHPEVKGDVARMAFYIATRYEGDSGELDEELTSDIPSSPSGEAFLGSLSTLLSWHENDPVDSFEQNRNEVVYSYQGNRNPFIDHPEYVSQIWGESGPSAPEIGDLYISEFSDASGTGNYIYEFIEIYNSTSDELDISNCYLQQSNSSQTFQLPAGVIKPHSFLIVGRNATQSQFETFWDVTLSSDVTYFNSSNSLPQINGDEVYLLEDPNHINLDPPTEDEYTSKAITSGNRVYRENTGNNIEDWSSTTSTTATPGQLDNDQTLPVTLSSFSLEYCQNAPHLFWETQSESENLGWNIFRSSSENGIDESQYITINPSLIPGAGTTSQITTYSYIDQNPTTPVQTYFYWLQSVSCSGDLELFGPSSLYIPTDSNLPETPQSTSLSPNYPNPFNPSTTITFQIKENQTGTLSIYNLIGQRLLQKKFIAGNHSFSWNADNFPTGIYLYKLQTPNFHQTRKMILIK